MKKFSIGIDDFGFWFKTVIATSACHTIHVHDAEIKKRFPSLTDKEMEQMVRYPGRDGYIANPNYDNDLVQILFFEYKTFLPIF